MRLFIAITLPENVKEKLGKLQNTSIPTAKWVNPAQIHLTLRFIGEVDQTTYEQIHDGLNTIQSPSFNLSLQGTGTFPPEKKKLPRVLWVGVRQSDILVQLAQKVEATLVNSGLAPESRAFSAHITLARLKLNRPAQEVDNFLKENGAFKTAPFPVSAFTLYQSDLTPKGPIYTSLHEYTLQP